MHLRHRIRRFARSVNGWPLVHSQLLRYRYDRAEVSSTCEAADYIGRRPTIPAEFFDGAKAQDNAFSKQLRGILKSRTWWSNTAQSLLYSVIVWMCVEKAYDIGDWNILSYAWRSLLLYVGQIVTNKTTHSHLVVLAKSAHGFLVGLSPPVVHMGGKSSGHLYQS